MEWLVLVSEIFWLLIWVIENSQLSNHVIKSFWSLPRKIFYHWSKIFNDLIDGGLISTIDLAIKFFWSLCHRKFIDWTIWLLIFN